MQLTVCSHNRAAEEAVCECLDDGLRRRSISYSMRRFHAVRDLLYDIEDGHHPDVLFLEIDSASHGEELLKRVRRAGYNGRIVLLCATDAYAVDGYDWGADAYWVYPIHPLKAVTCLERLVGTQHTACLTVRQRGRMLRVPYAQILYIESRNARCIIHCEDGTELTIYTRLCLLEEQLTDERFLRCHQSFLVNMDHVAAFDGAFVLDDGSIVSVRQRELRRFREWYIAYIARRDTAQYNAYPANL